MLTLRGLLLSLSILGVSAGTLIAQEPEKGNSPGKMPDQITFSQSDWVLLLDEPSIHMDLAHQELRNQRTDFAVHNLRKAAAFLRAGAAEAQGDQKQSLLAASKEIDGLAGDVKSGKIRSARQIDAAFARAEHSLASYQQQQADAAIKAKNHSRAGHYLWSATRHLERAAYWSGHELERGTMVTLDAARDISGKMIAGTGFATDKAGTLVSDLGHEVERFGKAIEADATARRPGAIRK